MSKPVGFGVGTTAGLLAIGMMFLIRYAFGVPAAPELIQDSIVQLFPGEVASQIIDRLQKSAKLLLFATVLLVQLGVLGLFGMWSAGPLGAGGGRLRPIEAAATWLRRPWESPVIWGLLWWILVVAVLFPNAGLGFSGSATSNGAMVTALASLGPPLTFVLGLMFGRAIIETSFSRSPYQTDGSQQAAIGRRRFLGLSLAAVVGTIVGGNLVKLATAGQDSPGAPLALSSADTRLNLPPTPTPTVIGHPGTPGVPDSGMPKKAPTPTPSPLPSGIIHPDTVPGISSELTSNKDFYVVSKNVIDPTVSVSRWRLKVEGLVDAPFQLTYDELRALPAVSQFTTLICISNPVGGPLISNAKWTGVPLRVLLERSRLKPGVKDIALFAADGYSDSIPLEKALEPTTLVAYGMNDELLPSSHGAPARLVVPGIYGMKNVKWLTGIEPVDEDFKGFWERRGWSDIAVIKTMSRMDVPDSRLVVPGRNGIGGVAFAGDRGISQVQWSVDDASWKTAVVKPSLSPFSWVLWADEWEPKESGVIRLRVRAIDGTGAVQTMDIAESFPDGTSGYHGVTVRVR